MAKQLVTVRLSEDDVSFLAGLDLPEATNLSEKLRALIAEARRQQDSGTDAIAAYDTARRALAGPERCLREAEMKLEMRSELLMRLIAWMPEVQALLLSGACACSEETEARERERLLRLERQLGERVMSLVDSMAQLAVAGFAGCYEPQRLGKRVQSAIRTFKKADEMMPPTDGG